MSSDVLTVLAVVMFPVVVIGHYMTAGSLKDSPRRGKAHAKAHSK